ncbi:MAG: transglycosylase domain-containing protein [Pseudomonadales bacterium]|nr:transglycosylase domain-containing protein [Pseudomonadales bacterium]
MKKNRISTFWKKKKQYSFEDILLGTKAQRKERQKKFARFPFLVRVLLTVSFSPLTWLLIAALFLTLAVGVLYLLKDLPSPRRITTGNENFAVTTQIFDRNGTLLYEVFGDENRIPIEIETLPPYVYQASISIEDKNFYNHFGFDIIGITRALHNNLTGNTIEGGSTITQQLVKNALLTREKSIQRKVKEAILAVFTEIIYSKKEILEMYMNYISYGGTSVGVESASQTYFGKPAAELTLAEAALLAGLPQAPSRYSPFGSDPSAAKNRQREVLRRMVEDGFITEAQASEAETQVLDYALSTTDIKAPHFVFYVRDLLFDTYGEEMVRTGGLRVYTSLDLDLQETAQASLSAEIDALERYRVGNGAAMVVKPNTGEILSMIGSTDYFDATAEGQVNVTLAYRQPGSSIKPLMYATAMEKKELNPGSILVDTPTCFTVPGQQPYCPKNYDGSFKGPITVRDSLGNSLNITAVKALRIIGVETFMNQATKMGITGWNDPSKYGLSLTLGGGEVRMLDMAQAFGVLANQGVKVPLNPILKIEDYNGNVLEEYNPEEVIEDLAYMNSHENDTSLNGLERVMHRAPAYLTSHIMQDNNARRLAFGPRSELVIPNQIVSAKTGTTNDLKDNWTVGFTPEFLVITWVGNNDNTPMNPYLVSGVTGAAPIWNDIMSYILQGKEASWQEKPEDVASGFVCASGFPTSSQHPCSGRYTELYWTESNPSYAELIKENVWINPETGLPPEPGQQVDGLVLEERTFYADPITYEYRFCEDCSRATNQEGDIQYEQRIIPHNLPVKHVGE